MIKRRRNPRAQERRREVRKKGKFQRRVKLQRLKERKARNPGICPACGTPLNRINGKDLTFLRIGVVKVKAVCPVCGYQERSFCRVKDKQSSDIQVVHVPVGISGTLYSNTIEVTIIDKKLVQQMFV